MGKLYRLRVVLRLHTARSENFDCIQVRQNFRQRRPAIPPLPQEIGPADRADLTGTEEARQMGILNPQDRVVMPREYLIAEAKREALHMAGSPITLFATVHAAAATENFMVCEHHSVDDEWYDDLVSGVSKPIIQNGYVLVPDTPGLGVDLVEEEVKRHLKKDEKYFAPTEEWNKERSWDRTWSQGVSPSPSTSVRDGSAEA